MTIKLNSLDRWKLLGGNQLVLAGDELGTERRVRLHVNSAEEHALYVTDVDGEQRLLTVVPAGLETVEFWASGRLGIVSDAPEGAEIWYQTAETEPTHVEVRDPVIFTKIANRRHRNPELEEIMYRMQANMDRRLAQQSEEFEAALERRRLEEVNGRQPETIETKAPGAAANAGSGAVSASEPLEPGVSAGTGAAVGSEPTGGGGD